MRFWIDQIGSPSVSNLYNLYICLSQQTLQFKRNADHSKQKCILVNCFSATVMAVCLATQRKGHEVAQAHVPGDKAEEMQHMNSTEWFNLAAKSNDGFIYCEGCMRDSVRSHVHLLLGHVLSLHDGKEQKERSFCGFVCGSMVWGAQHKQ